MASATRTIRVRFDGTAKGLIAAAAKAGIAVEGFEKQANKSSANLAKAGGGLVAGLVDAFGSLATVVKPVAITAAAGIGAAMAPVLASVLISGVLVAVGGGVLAAGIIGAAKSPKVVKAWQKVGRQATVIFERFSKPFIKPLERSAKLFAAALARAEPTIKRIGETMAPFVEMLVGSAGLFIEKLVPGILTAVTEAQPFLSIMLMHLPLLAESISHFFENISAGSGAAQVFFERFLTWVENLIPKLGEVLAWFANLGAKMEEFANGPQFLALKDALTNLKDNTLVGVKEGFDKIRTSIEENSATWKNMAKDIEGAINKLGPAVHDFVVSTAASIGFIIDVWARLYDAVRKVYQLIQATLSGADRLPGNLSGGNTHSSFGSIPGRARGGPVSAHRTYLVGEKGEPELLTMGAQSGRITPLSQVGAASSGMPPIEVNVTVELDGEPVGRRVRYEINESNRRTKRAVLAGAGAR